MSSGVSFTSKEFGRRFRKALSVPFLFDQACSTVIQDFVKSYAASIGCNEKCVLFPLLTCVAACAGPNSVVELAPNWREELIAWSLVITPMTLHRIDVAEHFREQLLCVQNELSPAKTEESGKPPCERFIVDILSLNELKETLKTNGGQALGIYNSTRVFHKNLEAAEDLEVMQRLHFGSSWFSSSKSTKKLLNKTHVNFCVLAKPSTVYNTISTVPLFQEVYHDCFLTICAEENHVKYSNLAVASQADVLRRIFKEIILLHSSGDVVYKLSGDAVAKFSQIHDEITDKAKQLARKSVKVFHPALSYLGRLSCILHILDSVIEAINWGTPIDPVTWTFEISADTVWRARQFLAYVIEQKFVLSQPTMVESTPNASKRVESVTIIDGSPTSARVASVRANLFNSQRSHISSRSASISPRVSYTTQQSPRYSPYNSPRSRNIVHSSARVGRPPADGNGSHLLLDSSTQCNAKSVQSNIIPDNSVQEPMISEVRSAGVPVPVGTAVSTPSNAVNDIEYGPEMSVSILPDSGPAVLNQLFTNGSDGSITSHSVSLMAEEEFFRTFKVQIRRILMHNMKDINLMQCVEMKFAPKSTGAQSSEETTSMARMFLKKLEVLGFGSFEALNGTGSSKMCIFKKRRFSALGDKQMKMLSDLRVSERDYDRCFSVHANKEDEASGNVVLLE